MTIQVKVPPLRPSMLFTDKNGNLTKDAYDFLFAVFNRIGGSLSSLDAASLLGANWSNPNPIGDVSPASGKFTTVTTTGQAILSSAQVTNGFGCNGKGPQVSYSVGSPVDTTVSTNTTPFGFATSTQADDIVAKLNAVIIALQNNGIIV